METFTRVLPDGGAVPADMCIDCGGLWINRPEIGAAYPEIDALLAEASRNPDALGISQIDCPICVEMMRGFVLEGIALDLCPRCSGIWIDGSEILALEEARPRIALRNDEPSSLGGYREAASPTGPLPSASMVCPGCGNEVDKSRMTGTDDGPRCRLCTEIANEPLVKPGGVFAQLVNAFRRLSTPCPTCGERRCEHRS